MKTITKKGFMMLLTATLVTTSIIAQPRGARGFGQGQGQAWDNNKQFTSRCELILDDLTEDQKAKLETLRLEHWQEMKNYRNQMGEIAAKQRTVMSQYDIDTDAADKLIDQKTDLKKKQMKARVSHLDEIKDVLTKEQYLKLEQFRQNRKYARSGRRGYHAGRANGFGQGQRGNRAFNCPRGNRGNW
ncbi:MAG TPA: periplasmic heavy metal sensor [Bacteroidales bacterium]|nr:periplasmic heavy metal sensor [Bacteroidales bacterium]